MINNRQNGRRRGRGGQQVRNGQPGGQDRGNRIDNRARGNAAQLLEKYKNLAGEAQRQGDRVNTEYYLQFADHYFRVLSESRARFEEQRPQRSDGGREDFGNDGDYADEGQRFESRGGQSPGDNWNDSEDEGFAPQQPERRVEQPRYEERPQREERAPREDRAPREEGDRRPRRQRNANGNGNGNAPYANGGNGNGHAAETEEQRESRIEVDRLPAGFGAAPVVIDEGTADAPAEEAAPRRRRAPRRPREETPAVEV
ncbi:hypothetical protein FHS31_000924 [Sphingomonas vulcanisoli]|uniref:DUF4167 domain-containing protein n=1 Tax=Sphingomonas vulcanisoli TaxID=1658060 RepID=A0ABX0TP69_9SPHN|nr:DUF4167 domain-containing protein [Sphingomonas vulcanisoli]NIJ07328.1 hypothetical protein [Sphingomonas vulcanisoli]